MANSSIRRCAIYTRKSSEEGLEQDYNSLNAQREACEAYVRSQAGEGWRLLKTAYDDGGFSGGTMERPALQQLLVDIRQGLVDLVVVYKVDRLTRALADFARMVELFDAQGVSFVAVTQQFNTTTSMGRLTLNVLLSFAQFEREVIGERIRDKVAASKRKGIWMGGTLPLGYEVHERKLIVNRDETRTVKHIFERYLELGSVRELKADLDRRGTVSPVKTSKRGQPHGGKPFSRGALYCLLSNPIYIGAIRHKQQCHAGQHEPIVSRELWQQVQARLGQQAVRQDGGGLGGASGSPLAGKLFNVKGEPLYVQGAARGKRRYRYYVSRKLVRGESDHHEYGWRISALQLECAVAAAARSLLADRAAIITATEASGIDHHRLPSVLKTAQSWFERLATDSETPAALAQVVERVELSANGIRLSLRLPVSASEHFDGDQPSSPVALAGFIPVQIKRRGMELRMVLEGDPTRRAVNLPLLKAVARARRWSEELIAGQVQSVAELAQRERLDRRSVRRLLPLGFLSPRLVELIVEGREPPDVTVIGLSRRVKLPLLWARQEQAIGVR